MSKQRIEIPQPEWPDLTVFVADAKGNLVPHNVSPVVADGKATYDTRHDDAAVAMKLALACSEFIVAKKTREPKAVADVLTKASFDDTVVDETVPSGEIGAFERVIE